MSADVASSVLAVGFFHLLHDDADRRSVDVRSFHERNGARNVIGVDRIEEGFEPTHLGELIEHERAFETGQVLSWAQLSAWIASVCFIGIAGTLGRLEVALANQEAPMNPMPTTNQEETTTEPEAEELSEDTLAGVTGGRNANDGAPDERAAP